MDAYSSVVVYFSVVSHPQNLWHGICYISNMSNIMQEIYGNTMLGVSVKWLDWAPYAITEDGKVYSQFKQRFLKLSVRPTGYISTLITPYKGESRVKYVHRLVAELYVPNPLNKPDVDHIDNNPSNNHYTNLQWVTHKENIQLSYTRDNREIKRGEDHWQYGKKYSDESKALMSSAKLGVRHPKFKGWYIYGGIEFESLQAVADHLQTYPMKAYRMFKKGVIGFRAV